MRHVVRLLLSLLIFVVVLLLITITNNPAQTGFDHIEGAAAPARSGTIVVDFVDGTSTREIADVERRVGLDLEYSSAVSEDEALTRGRATNMARAIAALHDEPLVEAAEPVMEFAALGFPDDPLYAKQWNMVEVGAPAGWRAGSGKGVKVAVIDTGVSRVPDLEGVRIAEGMSFVPGTASAEDDHGHGTHVAGTIAQSTNNGIGTVGLAPAATIGPTRCSMPTAWGTAIGSRRPSTRPRTVAWM